MGQWMENLAEELQDEFKKADKTGWRPGMGLWIGDTVQKLFVLENKLETLKNKLAEANKRITELQLVAAGENIKIKLEISKLKMRSHKKIDGKTIFDRDKSKK